MNKTDTYFFLSLKAKGDYETPVCSMINENNSLFTLSGDLNAFKTKPANENEYLFGKISGGGYAQTWTNSKCPKFGGHAFDPMIL